MLIIKPATTGDTANGKSMRPSNNNFPLNWCFTKVIASNIPIIVLITMTISVTFKVSKKENKASGVDSSVKNRLNPAENSSRTIPNTGANINKENQQITRVINRYLPYGFNAGLDLFG